MSFRQRSIVVYIVVACVFAVHGVRSVCRETETILFLVIFMRIYKKEDVVLYYMSVILQLFT
jgi:hypothetical protein